MGGHDPVSGPAQRFDNRGSVTGGNAPDFNHVGQGIDTDPAIAGLDNNGTVAKPRFQIPKPAKIGMVAENDMGDRIWIDRVLGRLPAIGGRFRPSHGLALFPCVP